MATAASCGWPADLSTGPARRRVLRRAEVIEVTSQRTARLDVAALRQAVLAEDAG